MPRLGSRSRVALALSFVALLAASALRSRAEDDVVEPVDIASAWIYENLDAGYAKAQETGKPLLIAFR